MQRRPTSRQACLAILICWAATPEGLTDEQVLFLSDIFSTGYMAAEFCHIQNGDTIAVWGSARSGSSLSAVRFCWAQGG
jgi:D-arabinose 1-dehydrogenase-like Zn-dependent alcohol dehydrogenase